MKRIQISQVGLGAWGQKIHSRVSALPEFEYVGVAQRSLKNFANYRTLAEMLDAYLPDLVLVATPVETHFELARQALEKNCHVWITKPIVIHAKELESLQTLARVKNLHLFYDHTYIFNSQFQTISQNLSLLSPVLSIRVQRGHSGGHQNFSTALEEVLYHDIYMTRSWLKEDPKTVSLVQEKDSLVLELEFSKAQVSLEGSLDWSERKRSVELKGQDWKITWNEDQLSGVLSDSGVLEPGILEPGTFFPISLDAIQRQFLSIAQVLRQGTAPRVLDSEAFKVHQIIEKARLSLQQNGKALSCAD